MKTYKIVAKTDRLAVHSIGYFGEEGRKKAQDRIDSGCCSKYWMDYVVASVTASDIDFWKNRIKREGLK